MTRDQELMLSAGGGDNDAFEELVRRNQQQAWGLAYRLLGDPAEAEDIAQEAFLKIFKAADRYRPTAKFKTYLYRVVSRLCYDRTAKKKPLYSDDLPINQDNPGQLKRLVESEQDKKIQVALSNLPERQRRAVVFNHFDNLSYAEISEVMETSEKAVERLLARGRQTLREKLTDMVKSDEA